MRIVVKSIPETLKSSTYLAMAVPDPYAMTTCPYQKSHQVEHYRMHIHLQKCRKQHPNCKKITCPFDATHIINDVEIEYHVGKCPKRNLLDNQMYVMDDDFRPLVDVTPAPVLPCGEENWDDDYVNTYVPDPSKKGSHIITKIQGATPSERRKARMEGVQKYRPMEEK